MHITNPSYADITDITLGNPLYFEMDDLSLTGTGPLTITVTSPSDSEPTIQDARALAGRVQTIVDDTVERVQYGRRPPSYAPL